jgi:hypothetical protein
MIEELGHSESIYSMPLEGPEGESMSMAGGDWDTASIYSMASMAPSVSSVVTVNTE